MKRLSLEITYLLNRLLFGLFLVPGILWAIARLLALYANAAAPLPITDYYLQFYARLDSPINWLWIVSPYLVFLLTRPRARIEKDKAQGSLRRAAGKGQQDTVKTLIDNGTDIHAANVRGQIPLHMASMTDNVDVVRMLVQGGADIDVMDPVDHIRPLHNCAINGCVHVCEFLLKHGADMDAQTQRGDTALHLAAQHKRLDVVSLMLGYHVNHALQNKAGLTAEQIATARGYARIAELIHQHTSSEWQYPRMAPKNTANHVM